MRKSTHHWIYPEKVTIHTAFGDILMQQNIHPVIQKLLVQRKIDTAEKLNQFLNPSIENLYDPFLMHDMQKAVERLQIAIENGESILVYGDYDADGITSTSVIVETLEMLGANVSYYLPNRFKDGYGPNVDVYRQKIEEGIELILTVDNGVAGHEAIDYANQQGIDVIVTDHHELPEQLPDAFAIVHPRHPEGNYPFGELAGVGVAFKLACALIEEVPYELLELVAIGTVADMVSLTDENRIFVRLGLEMMKQTQRIGLKTLMEVSEVNLKELDEQTIGFALAPRLNALGRLDDPNPAVHLMLTFDEEEAYQLAKQIDLWNQKRKDLVDEITSQAIEKINPDNYVHVIAGENWHEGVLGIVAGRILKETGKPTIVLSINENNQAKGSGRSVESFNLFESMGQVREIFEKFGGHHSAVGLTIKLENIAKLQDHLNQSALGQHLTFAEGLPLQIDEIIEISEVSVSLIEQFKVLAPFGMDNPTPNFLIKNVKVSQKRAIGANQNHLKLVVNDKSDHKLDVVGFNQGMYIDELGNENINLVGQLSINEWNGNTSCQLMLSDFSIDDLQVFDYRPKKFYRQLNFDLPTLYIASFEKNRKNFQKILDKPIYLVEEIDEMTDVINYQQIVFLDCPLQAEDYLKIYQQFSVSRVFFVCYTHEDAYVDGVGSKEQFAKLFKFIQQQKRIDVRYKLDLVEKYLKIPKKLLIFMIQVFFDLKFVKIEDGVLSYIENPPKHSLTESQTYQNRLQKIKTEEFFLLSNLETLKNWLIHSQEEH